MKIYLKIFIYFKLLFILYLNFIKANQCYSCAGTCHNEPCNCQIGSCEADFCFIERKPAEIPGAFRITKGCLKRPSRTQYGCDYDHFNNQIQCVCRGNFCNDAIYFRHTFRRNVTCRSCSERNPDCDDSCQGQWCHEDTVSGVTGCGFGPPSMPFFYKGPELLFNRNKLCITLSRGNNAKPRKYCICNTHLCNDFLAGSRYYGEAGLRLNQQETNGPRSRSLVTYNHATSSLSYHKCVSCDTTAQDNAMTSGCKQNNCIGHFCTLATQRIISSSANAAAGRMNIHAQISEKQGCINVTDHHKIQLGCTHKWMNNEEEELFCACIGDLCNKDLNTASASKSTPVKFLYELFLTILLQIFFILFQ